MKHRSSSSYPLLIVLLCLTLSSCVENIIHIQIHPRGDYSVKFTARGDSTDLFNDDFVIPTGAGWKTVRSIEEEDDDEKYVIESTRHVRRGGQLPSNFSRDNYPSEIKLHHPLVVDMEDRFFSRRFRLNYTFRGRQMEDKYAALKDVLDDEETAGWQNEVIRYIASEGLNRAKEELPGAVSALLVTEIEAALDSALSSFREIEEDSVLIEWMESKGDWISSLMDGVESGPSQEFLVAWEHQMNTLEKEVTITMDLDDDSFKVFATLPGSVVSGNYDSLNGDTLGWEFSLEDFVDNDYVMEAESRLEMPQRIRSLIVLAAVMVLFVIATYAGSHRERRKQSISL
ncbi:MAG: hypothetical protein V3U24_10345 [Candidatus Neomarinimicrobiota bacterium]